jgi:5-methylthioadenosine/S-adenosylhomocysteine deaminase
VDTIIKAKFILSEQGLLKDSEIHISEGEIVHIGPNSSSNAEFVFDFPKGLLLPAFINAHTHLPETLIRGLCDDEDLHTWLYDHVWKVEPYMTHDQAKIGTLLGIAEMVSSGTIGFVDQFYFADKIAEAVAETGVKAFLAPSIFEGNAETKTIEKSFQQNKVVYDKWHCYDNRILIGFGPHAPYTVEKELFERIIHEAKQRKTFIHTHLNETEKEVTDAINEWNCSPIEYMNRLDGLSNIIGAHCVHTSDTDRQLLQKHNVTVLSNPTSNLKTGSGIAPIPDYIQRGINVCLATDGSASNNNLNMLEEARLTALLHKGIHKNPKLVSIHQIIPMITSNASKIFSSQIYTGRIAISSPADLVVYDLSSVNTTPIINPLSNWLFAAHPSEVVLTMANGKILYEDGEFKTLNIQDIKVKAQEAIEDMMQRSEYTPLSFR